MPSPETNVDHPSATSSEILDDLDASPTPYHAVSRAAQILTQAGFEPADETRPLSPKPGPRFITRGGSLVAWVQPDRDPRTFRGFNVVGAHTDSPNLRVRPNPDSSSANFSQVGMEVYGGILANSWLDRDLGLAGRIAIGGENGEVIHRLFRDDDPILRIPQLAIHLDRQIREKGLQLNSQKHLLPIWALGKSRAGDLASYVAEDLGVKASSILAWDLMAFDVQPPAIIGRDKDMFASARIDNLASTFCGVRALAKVTTNSGPSPIPVLVLYDHEEVGSTSSAGAGGNLLTSSLERIAGAMNVERNHYLALLSDSLVISADGSHATHPNYADKHEPNHSVTINQGVVIKRNANQRYATDTVGEAVVVAALRAAGIPLQHYISRNDMPCGSTIGPITSARTGIPTVDIGIAQLAMHSIREMAGLTDLEYLHDALHTIWQRPRASTTSANLL